ncbi:MAG: hypothetical protein J6Y28_00875 [Acholeplasmatales bacterium]|nr:hypothetical protein [Acholeplasmatales bacterium]
MSCLDNTNKVVIPTHMLLDMMKLYRFSGKDSYYNSLFSKDLKAYRNVNIIEEVYYFSKIMNLDITDERLKLLSKKDIIPKNNSEKIVLNLKKVFNLILFHVEEFDLIPNEIQNLANLLYDGVYKFKYKSETVVEKGQFLASKKKISKADTVEYLFNKFETYRKSKEYEVTLLITNLFIDFLNSRVFEENDNYDANTYVPYLILYILLFKFEFDVFNYKSYFSKIYENMKTFQNAIIQSSFNWDTGYASVTQTHQFIIERLLECYDNLEDEERKVSHVLENKFSKTNDVEITITHFPGDTFTKADIQKIHPNVSAKTIERTLERLQQEGKIESLGTGRSARWMKKFKMQAGFEYDKVAFNFDDDSKE